MAAIVPALLWLYVFLRYHRSNKWLVLLTFIGGMIAAKIILIYAAYWGSTVNLIFFKVNLVDFRSNIESIIVNTTLSLFTTFVGVGVMEEFFKFWIVTLVFWLMGFTNYNFLKSIDDVITLAIASALGFAFYENVIYFLEHAENLTVGGFFIFALFRVTVVTMVHILCSGILGYYYGMAYFASPMLQIKEIKRENHPILNFFKNVLHLKASRLYHYQMITIGLLLSMVLHALYDFILSLEYGFLYIPVMMLYFFGGYHFLMNLIRQKDMNLKLGLVGTQVMPKEDFAKLLEQVQSIKEKMRTETTDKPIAS